MQIKIDTKIILKILLVLSWIIFTGLCIEAGAHIVNAAFAFGNQDIFSRLWKQVDLSDLFQFDRGYFFVVTLLMSIVTVLEAWLFFLIIRVLHQGKFNLAMPFNKELRRFIFRLSSMALWIGLFSKWGLKYAEWLTSKGVKMPDTRHLNFDGADVWIFMAVILFMIALIFKRGMEIQSENELTI